MRSTRNNNTIRCEKGNTNSWRHAHSIPHSSTMKFVCNLDVWPKGSTIVLWLALSSIIIEHKLQTVVTIGILGEHNKETSLTDHNYLL